MTRDTKYWIIVASKDHVKTGITEGIVQTCHGKASPLKRMRKDDLINRHDFELISSQMLQKDYAQEN
ncbi:EVE domain-containing protein [Chitinophaga sp. CF118]|uniref:EVE domain-containing protein n=1 Tax=Chitinophaga sp. CF118 TaxID=1884367 RepID=UPI0008E4EEB0|nr:EVE domain-containing protein [Chitinophaga sp. CF118]SFE62120.1 EVE domain-containing protein [Chitinophaga sp. CF118]